jgi:hypothetical protein
VPRSGGGSCQTGLFRAGTYRLVGGRGIRFGLLWGALGLYANLLWDLGPRTSLGHALIAAAFPLLIAGVKVGNRPWWRQALCHALSFCIPACTLFLFLALLPPRGDMPANPTEKLVVILQELAEFVRENAITTAAGLLTLLAAHRPSASKAEGKAFRATLFATGFTLLSISTFSALVAHCLLKLI